MTVPPSNRGSSPKRSTSSKQAKSDSYYGHEEVAKMCARFITALFSCPDVPPPPASGAAPTGPQPTLAAFIAYALHRTRLASSVTYCALFLLSRLKGRFPAARGSSGHRLFISAFMIASKVICDDTYSNKSWCVVGQGMFSLREINQMEREMCSYLEWVLNVKPEELAEFEAEVKRDYGTGGLKTGVAPSPVTPTTATTSPTTIPTSSVPPVSVRSTASSIPTTRPNISYNTTGTPESSPPSPSHSDSSSPASSEPRTPPTPDVPTSAAARAVGPTSRGGMSAVKGGASMPMAKPVVQSHPAVQVKVVEERIPGNGQPFAFASAAEW
ncbi:hypothetical protein FRC04_000752 [Tulasnella sp. 424]|nr:hypothetical protein FRC04_000752 [Tulasnella sp. 424]